jgi:hypothetical protein
MRLVKVALDVLHHRSSRTTTSAELSGVSDCFMLSTLSRDADGIAGQVGRPFRPRSRRRQRPTDCRGSRGARPRCKRCCKQRADESAKKAAQAVLLESDDDRCARRFSGLAGWERANPFAAVRIAALIAFTPL